MNGVIVVPSWLAKRALDEGLITEDDLQRSKNGEVIEIAKFKCVVSWFVPVIPSSTAQTS